MSESTFASALPRLVHAYEAGRLVPFLGAGMSAALCPTWPQFIAAVERAAGIEVRAAPHHDSDELTRRGDRAVRRLKRTSPEGFADSIRQALFPARESVSTPLGYGHNEPLARLWWPLVLTTNYDHLFLSAFREQQDPRMQVLGRSPSDCRAVLHALGTPAQPILWALQGYLGGPDGAQRAKAPVGEPSGARLDELTSQLVIGHPEYRRVAHASPHFRRAFTEVFRSRSLLFLGCSLRDRYLLELFGEILETYGPSQQPHFAFVQQAHTPDDFREFLGDHVNIRALPFDHYAQVSERLAALHETIDRRRRRAGQRHHFGPVQLVSAPLPAPGEHDAMLRVADAGVGLQRESEHAWRLGSLTAAANPLYALGQSLADVLVELAPAVQDGRVQRLRLPLPDVALVAGGLDPRLALLTLVRRYARLRMQGTAMPELVVHDAAPPVLLEVASRRIDIAELLDCPDLRLRLEIIGCDGGVEERTLYVADDLELDVLLGSLHIQGEQWRVSLDPAPCPGHLPRTPAELADETLATFGLVAGSTLRLEQVVPGIGDAIG